MEILKCHYCSEPLTEETCCGMYGDLCPDCDFSHSAKEHADDEEASVVYQ